MAHIGIVACSAEGAALCYRTICLEAFPLMGEHNHPQITMNSIPMAEHMRYIEQDDWEGVADVMLKSAKTECLLTTDHWPLTTAFEST